jgi:plastocyanin
LKARILRSSLVGAALFAALALAACGGGGDSDSNGDNGNGGNGDDDTTIPADATEFVVSMQDNKFVPAEFSIKKGQTVTVIAKNEGTAVHNMVVVGTNMKSDALVQPGAESRFEIRFDNEGDFDIQCDYHLPDMVGVITVK